MFIGSLSIFIYKYTVYAPTNTASKWVTPYFHVFLGAKQSTKGNLSPGETELNTTKAKFQADDGAGNAMYENKPGFA